MRLKDKGALIAGAEPGSGRAVAFLFAQEGAKVGGYRPPQGAPRGMVNTIRQRGGEASWVQADVTSASGAGEMVRRAVATYGKLDILYNNTGFFIAGEDRLAETKEADLDALLDTNLKSAFLSSKYALPELLKNGRGVIINVAAAFPARQGGNATYGASKAGGIGLTQNMAREYRRDNIRINCICPLAVGASRGGERVEATPLPLVRGGQPQDVAYAALYLASDEASFVVALSW